MSILVIKPGLFATVQDSGRFGYQRHGVVVGGAADPAAARAANILVGNHENMALLELTWTGAELQAERDYVAAICGGDMDPHLDGQACPMWRPFLLRAGSRLVFRKRISGYRSYVAIAGGIDVPLVMDSRSTYARAGVGGFQGRALMEGDRLEALPLPVGSPGARLQAQLHSGGLATTWHAGHFAAVSRDITVVRAMEGSHFGMLKQESRRLLTDSVFRVDVQSDRMGCRLEGESLELDSRQELLSEAVTAGTVQLPSGGKPIVLLADRQTTGGYARILSVATVDIPVFAQLMPGAKLRFELISHRDAEELLLESERDFKLLRAAVGLKIKESGRAGL
ncbi:5-oxoprolinase subunit C family protein [Paenibacillus sp. CAU 1782]